MSAIDWLVLFITLLLIVIYGIYKSRNIHNINGFLLGDKSLPWYNVGLSVMATQASAITFLSAPGLGYSSGMSFVQFYFGLPLAMIVLCITFVPIFNKLQVFTAYEFLEKRFDIRTRALTAVLFLIQRGISTGITIFAPALILSSVLHIDTTITTVVIGIIVIVYTAYGGSKAVSYTQLLQMGIIFSGLLLAGMVVIHLLPQPIGFTEALHIAGKSGKTNAIDLTFNLNNQYTLWTGLIGGFFLQLSYFGTDQSQVGRYLTGASTKESRMGLLMNGLLKIPMQFCILLIGVLVFVYYQFNSTPLFFNTQETSKLETSIYADDYQNILHQQDSLNSQKSLVLRSLINALDHKETQVVDRMGEEIKSINEQGEVLRKEVIHLIEKNNSSADTNDNNYIFLHFITTTFPKGLIGLLIAIIMLASMGATASAINSLTSTSVIDIYKRFINKKIDEKKDLRISRLFTIGWGVFTVTIALFANKLGNLLEAVNILGSLFYGTILGIFLVAFYIKRVRGKAVFWSAIVTELIIIVIWQADIVAFLWLNVIGCIILILTSLLIEYMDRLNNRVQKH